MLEERLGKYIESLNASILNQNWYAVLVTALVLPDICASLSKHGKTHRRDYEEWATKYFCPNYPRGFLVGGDLYALRCAMLHQGQDNLDDQYAKVALDKFSFTIPVRGLSMNNNKVVTNNGTVLQLQVDKFGMSMIGAVEKWMNEVKDDKEVEKRAEKLVSIQSPWSFPGFGFIDEER